MTPHGPLDGYRVLELGSIVTGDPDRPPSRMNTSAAVPASRIYTIADIFADPHYAAGKMLTTVKDDDLGSVTVPAVAPRLSATPGAVRHGGRRIGQDTRSVLREAGFTDTEITELEKRHVVACDPLAHNQSPQSRVGAKNGD